MPTGQVERDTRIDVDLVSGDTVRHFVAHVALHVSRESLPGAIRRLIGLADRASDAAGRPVLDAVAVDTDPHGRRRLVVAVDFGPVTGLRTPPARVAALCLRDVIGQLGDLDPVATTTPAPSSRDGMDRYRAGGRTLDGLARHLNLHPTVAPASTGSCR